MRRIEFSIIVLTYNATLSAILLTLQSLIEQEFDRFEIIIADDNSKEKYFTEIQNYFVDNNFERYKILDSIENVGTVKNYIRGIQLAEGKYIKPIGAGDFLYDKTILDKLHTFLEKNNAVCGFGLMEAYWKDKQYNIYKSNFRAPISINPYLNNDLHEIKKSIVFQGDYISGATLFGEKFFLLNYLTRIEGIVRFAEDIIQILILLDNEKISFINEKIIFYEMGDGISTKKNGIKGKPLMNIDHEEFWKYVGNHYINKELLKRCDIQIKLLNENSKIKKNILMIIKNRREFFNNQIRKMWRKNLKEKLSEGFLEKERFIDEVQKKANL